MEERNGISSEEGASKESGEYSKFVDLPDVATEAYAVEHQVRSQAQFSRALAPRFIDLLKAESEKKSGWWSDVLADPGLVIALRGSYLNVYWQGQSIFYVETGGAGLRVTTHEKFLIDPSLKAQVALQQNGKFAVDNLRKFGVMGHYGDDTLNKMKVAASYYAGLEKMGCHRIAVKNKNFVDCEIAVPTFSDAQTGVLYESGRIDIACFEETKDTSTARLVFWEAKHFHNTDIRAKSPALPRVGEQIRRYRAYLSAHQDQILTCYKSVAQNLVALQEIGWCRKLSPLIHDVAAGGRTLVMGDKPKVGLLIFGFDKPQRDDKEWKCHLKRLSPPDIDSVIATGKAEGINL